MKTKYITKFLGVIYVLVMLMFTGCKPIGLDRTVTVVNDTIKDITIIHLSTGSEPSLPVTIASGESKILKWVRMNAEAVYFTVEYDGKRYKGDTGYVQDYTNYTLRFLLNDKDIASQTVVPSESREREMVLLSEVTME